MPAKNRKNQTTAQLLNDLDAYSPVVIKFDVTVDSTVAKQAFVAPFAMQIYDIGVLAQATVGGGTITPSKAANAMCTAITCAVDGAMTRLTAGAVVANKAYMILAKGDVVNVTAANAGDRGIVTFWGQRI